MDNNIGNARRAYARRNGKYTQEDAARDFCVSLSAYRNWEQGKYLPNASVANDIAKKYEVTVDYLLGISNTPQRPQPSIAVSPAESELVSLFRRMGARERELLLDNARTFAKLSGTGAESDGHAVEGIVR